MGNKAIEQVGSAEQLVDRELGYERRDRVHGTRTEGDVVIVTSDLHREREYPLGTVVEVV